MSGHGYKKYMKKDKQQENPMLKIFILSFFGMLLIMTFLIKSFAPTVDTSIGGDQEQISDDADFDSKKIVDSRLEMIQNEDQGRNFSDLMKHPDDTAKNNENKNDIVIDQNRNDNNTKPVETKSVPPAQDIVYKVFIGNYSSVDQAKVQKEIIQESGNGLNPIVKCIGSNSYTLQVGIFKNKQSAEAMLLTVLQNNLPGRIVQDY